ncbi:MAG: hypothetical protein JWN04_3712 [Myxococcaceae bacterium]|nr:hypothetical protein [Myxococcaceae bacterium]
MLVVGRNWMREALGSARQQTTLGRRYRAIEPDLMLGADASEHG